MCSIGTTETICPNLAVSFWPQPLVVEVSLVEVSTCCRFLIIDHTASQSTNFYSVQPYQMNNCELGHTNKLDKLAALRGAQLTKIMAASNEPLPNLVDTTWIHIQAQLSLLSGGPIRLSWLVGWLASWLASLLLNHGLEVAVLVNYGTKFYVARCLFVSIPFPSINKQKPWERDRTRRSFEILSRIELSMQLNRRVC